MNDLTSLNVQMSMNRVYTLILQLGSPLTNDDEGGMNMRMKMEEQRLETISGGSSSPDLFSLCSGWCGGGQVSPMCVLPSRKCLL